MGSSPLLQDPQHGDEPETCLGTHLSSHRRLHCPPQEISSDGHENAKWDIATNGKENISVFEPHFKRVFNNHCPVDLTILDKIA